MLGRLNSDPKENLESSDTSDRFEYGAPTTGLARIFARSAAKKVVFEMTDGYFRLDLHGNLIMADQRLAELLSYENGAAMIASLSEDHTALYADDNTRTEFLKKLISNGEVRDFVTEVHSAQDKDRLWVKISARLVKNWLGVPVYFEGIMRDCTDTKVRMNMERAYRGFADSFGGVLFEARWSADDEFSIPFSSRRFKDLIGHEPKEVRDDAKFLFRMIHPDDYKRFIDAAKASAKNGQPWEIEFRIVRESGEYVWIELRAMPEIQANGGCRWYGLMSEATQRKESEERIHALAYFDTLTKLPNRRMLLEKLDEALTEAGDDGSKGALLFIDLDNFKVLNDTRGHVAGDDLLCQLANRLAEKVGNRGTVARFGGDEFVVLLTQLSEDTERATTQATQIADDLIECVDEPVNLKSGAFHTTCSIGGALFDGRSQSSDDILKYADTAMYSAKRAGKNRVRFFEETMRQYLVDGIAMMADLRRAIEKDELSLHYQIQVDRAGKPVGAEALLRWHHSRKGFIPPSQFISVAEETGAIIPVTAWILEEAFQTLARWKKIPQLAKLQLSINISARQFHEPSFVSDIKQMIDMYAVDPRLLTLEMTEHVLNHDGEHVRRSMQTLKDLGVCFSLDDFGTGYSSLTNLRDLPFDEVKVDGKFVSELHREESDRALVGSIIAMAKALGVKTVAEWVENDEQRTFLIDAECDVLQGYLYGPAVPAIEFEALVNKRVRTKETAFEFPKEAVLEDA